MPNGSQQFCGDLAPNLRRFVKVESSLKKTSEQKVEMENFGMQNLTQGEENMAIASPDDRVQVEEQAVSSNAVAVIRDQNDQVSADNGVGSGSELISISTIYKRYLRYVYREHLPPSVGARYVLPICNCRSAVRRFMNLPSSSDPANLQSISASYRRLRDLRLGLVLPEEHDDGDISEELRNAAVAAGDDIPEGHIRVPVTVQNTCPIAYRRLQNFVRIMTIVSPEDAPTRFSETTNAYFNCYRRAWQRYYL